jgi:hypothetical protein
MQWPKLKLIDRNQWGNCKLSDNAYDVLGRDDSISLLRKSFWQKMTEPMPQAESNDCDDAAIRAMMRSRSRHVSILPPAIGYASGLIDGFNHAVNIIVTHKEIWFWDDRLDKILVPGSEVYFLWI